MVGALALVAFMVRSTLAGANDKNNVTGIYIKILMNHIQLIMLTASFNFDWPDQVTSLFDSIKPVASASTQVMSFDCFLTAATNTTSVSTTTAVSSNSNTDVSWTRIFFLKLVMLALLPFIVFLASTAFWAVYKLLGRVTAPVSGKALSTLVIVLFLVHPNIVQYTFFNFKCLDVDGESRV